MPLYLQSFLVIILTHFVEFTHSVTFQNGANTGFWCWLGFIMPVQFTASLFSGKTKKLFLLDTGCQLVTILLVGGILAVWK